MDEDEVTGNVAILMGYSSLPHNKNSIKNCFDLLTSIKPKTISK